MIYIETDSNNRVFFTHYVPLDPVDGMGKTEEELRKTGYLVDSLPEYTEFIPEDKRLVLYYDGKTFSQVLEDRNPSSSNDLEQRVANLEKVQNAQLGLEE